jgi:uncharacterized protein (TIGR02246 family)
MGLSVADQLEILQLLYRYGHALDSGDAEGFAALFTDDGTFTDLDHSVVGHDGLAGLVIDHHRDHPEAITSQHWLQSPVITGDGDTAEVDAYVIVFKKSELAGAIPAVMGTYHDVLRRLPDRGWCFHQRIVSRPPTRPISN